MAETRSTLLEVKQYYGRVQNYINGEWVDSSTDNWLDVQEPASGRVIAEVPLSTAAEVNAAVAAAQSAFKSWRDTPPPDRVQRLWNYKNLLEENWEELSRHREPREREVDRRRPVARSGVRYRTSRCPQASAP